MRNIVHDQVGMYELVLCNSINACSGEETEDRPGWKEQVLIHY